MGVRGHVGGMVFKRVCMCEGERKSARYLSEGRVHEEDQRPVRAFRPRICRVWDRVKAKR